MGAHPFLGKNGALSPAAPSPLISPYILSCIYKLKFELWITSCQGNQFADVLKTFDDDQEEFRGGGLCNTSGN